VLSIQLFTKKYIPVFIGLVIIATTTLGTKYLISLQKLTGTYTIGDMIFCFPVLVYIAVLTKNSEFKCIPIIDRNKIYWLPSFSNSLGTAFGDYLDDVLD
jgi:uncharacterized membrane-anchored protein